MALPNATYTVNNTVASVTVSTRYDPYVTELGQPRPEREDAEGGHWHYEYERGVTISTFHSADAYPDC